MLVTVAGVDTRVVGEVSIGGGGDVVVMGVQEVWVPSSIRVKMRAEAQLA